MYDAGLSSDLYAIVKVPGVLVWITVCVVAVLDTDAEEVVLDPDPHAASNAPETSKDIVVAR